MTASELQVPLPDGQHRAAGSAALPPDRGGIPGQRTALPGGQIGQAVQVDGEPAAAAGRGGRRQGGEEFRGGQPVELRELGQPGHGDRAASAFVGADGLHGPPALGLLLDLLEGQPPLPADGPQPPAESGGVLLGHTPKVPRSARNTASIRHGG